MGDPPGRAAAVVVQTGPPPARGGHRKGERLGVRTGQCPCHCLLASSAGRGGLPTASQSSRTGPVSPPCVGPLAQRGELLAALRLGGVRVERPPAARGAAAAPRTPAAATPRRAAPAPPAGPASRPRPRCTNSFAAATWLGGPSAGRSAGAPSPVRHLMDRGRRLGRRRRLGRARHRAAGGPPKPSSMKLVPRYSLMAIGSWTICCGVPCVRTLPSLMR